MTEGVVPAPKSSNVASSTPDTMEWDSRARRMMMIYLPRASIDTKGRETMKWTDGKEYPLLKIEISSESHPFYTGKQKIVDTAGRIEKFKRRYAPKAKTA